MSSSHSISALSPYEGIGFWHDCMECGPVCQLNCLKSVIKASIDCRKDIAFNFDDDMCASFPLVQGCVHCCCDHCYLQFGLIMSINTRNELVTIVITVAAGVVVVVAAATTAAIIAIAAGATTSSPSALSPSPLIACCCCRADAAATAAAIAAVATAIVVAECALASAARRAAPAVLHVVL
ncbi:hypothetical protein BJV78DRAFT_1268980 [Lactifluus subvellereus]|nr:hypothetical protein BJV78DRAFT_1268980 [Lactifluus subvellereus]